MRPARVGHAHEAVVQVGQPPVAVTGHVPMSVPVGPSGAARCSPGHGAGDRAEKPLAPVPRLTPLILIQSPLPMAVTSMPPSMQGSVSIPPVWITLSRLNISASWRTNGLTGASCATLSVVGDLLDGAIAVVD